MKLTSVVALAFLASASAGLLSSKAQEGPQMSLTFKVDLRKAGPGGFYVSGLANEAGAAPAAGAAAAAANPAAKQMARK